MAIAAAIYFFFKWQGVEPTPDPDGFWSRQGVYVLLAAAVPALWYLPSFKRALDGYVAELRTGRQDPNRTVDLLRRLSIGGALCELPMALGVVQLLMQGGQLRLFLGGAFIAFALRLSYRPFAK